jgi:hypothetical protein
MENGGAMRGAGGGMEVKVYMDRRRGERQFQVDPKPSCGMTFRAMSTTTSASPASAESRLAVA